MRLIDADKLISDIKEYLKPIGDNEIANNMYDDYLIAIEKQPTVTKDTSSVLESINIIDCLNDQIMAILDLLVCQSEEGIVDIKSVSMAADMVSNMQLDLMAEVEKITEVAKA